MPTFRCNYSSGKTVNISLVFSVAMSQITPWMRGVELNDLHSRSDHIPTLESERHLFYFDLNHRFLLFFFASHNQRVRYEPPLVTISLFVPILQCTTCFLIFPQELLNFITLRLF